MIIVCLPPVFLLAVLLKVNQEGTNVCKDQTDNPKYL